MKLNIIHFKVGDKYAYIENSLVKETDISKLIHGEQLKEPLSWNEPIIKRRTYKFPDLMGVSSTELYVSEKLKNILISKIDIKNLKFYEIVLSNHKYFLLNVLNNLSCFDWEKSIYTTYANPKVIRRISRLVLNRESIGNRNLFKVKEYPKYLIISPSLKEYLIENNITGCDFNLPNLEIDTLI